jgi:hypothetical protein
MKNKERFLASLGMTKSQGDFFDSLSDLSIALPGLP